MVEVRWTEPAVAELDAMADYIALDNSAAAMKLVRRVFERVTKLSTHPHLGPRLSELPRLGYRQLSVPPCRIIYRRQTSKIFIICVFRAEQRLDPRLLLRANK
jgi:toxin ParE1/3/4